MSSPFWLHVREFRRELCDILSRAVQVWHMVPWPHQLALGVSSVVMTLASVSTIGIPLLLGWLITYLQAGVIAGTSRPELAATCGWVLAGIAGLIFVREILNVSRRYLVENTCTRIEKHLNVRLVSHLLRVDLSRMTHEKLGALHGRISRSIEGFLRFLRISFLDFFPALITGGLAIAATLAKEPGMALAMAGVIPVSLAITAVQLITQKGIRLSLMRGREQLDGTVVEQLTGLDYVRAANTIDTEVQRVERSAEVRRATGIKHHFEMSLFGCAKALTEGVFHILVIGTALYLALDGRIGFGEVLTYSILFLNVMTPLSEVHRVLDEGHESSLRVADLLEILQQPIDHSFAATTADEPTINDRAPAIEVHHLGADYTLADGRKTRALCDVSLSIDRGETVGVAGRSGSGKSTWLKVLLRLVHPTEGRVRIFGVPLEKLSRETISRLIGYVGQQPFVFHGTIAENIAYGCGSPTLEQIKLAAKCACLHDEILAMPDGYDTTVAERGQNLSGGQRQRLAIARVFLKDPPILILDEATSALDTINERKVQRAIEAACAYRTVILVAHRLSSFADADRVVVFDSGRITEVGTYEELADKGGTFSELVRHAEREVALAT